MASPGNVSVTSSTVLVVVVDASMCGTFSTTTAIIMKGTFVGCPVTRDSCRSIYKTAVKVVMMKSFSHGEE